MKKTKINIKVILISLALALMGCSTQAPSCDDSDVTDLVNVQQNPYSLIYFSSLNKMTL